MPNCAISDSFSRLMISCSDRCDVLINSREDKVIDGRSQAALVQREQNLPGLPNPPRIQQHDRIKMQLPLHLLRVDGVVLKDLPQPRILKRGIDHRLLMDIGQLTEMITRKNAA